LHNKTGKRVINMSVSPAKSDVRSWNPAMQRLHLTESPIGPRKES
jgi:hypothetical protein